MPHDGPAATLPATVGGWRRPVWRGLPWCSRRRRSSAHRWRSGCVAGTLVGAGATLVAALVALAPWVTTLVVVVVVWLLRSGSLAGSAAGARRQLRGRRWYDAPQLLLHAPWHLVQSIPGAAMLLTWAGGLALAAALVCYAVSAALPVSLAVIGGVLALGLWWGPGGSRLRGPLSRVIDPVSRRAGPWAATLAAVLVVALGVGLTVEARGVSWIPGTDRPFAER